jgi:D-sedoheptulose 7-phosphate isomerase
MQVNTSNPHVAPSTVADPVDDYLTTLAGTLARLDRGQVWAVVELLIATAVAGRRVYIVGNGGSAATASHMANDLNKQASVPGAPPFRAIALTDNVPLITAWSNDLEFAEAFARQLANHVEAGDVVVALSTSGRSPNVLRALDVARSAGATTVGFTGDEGGDLDERVDLCLHVPSPLIGQQEDVHLVLNHVISYAICARLAAP